MINTNFKDVVVYEIHPQSFKDSNNDGIGDILGIIQKLDYLKELGVDYIWLNPIYVSPLKDNGYDVADYKNINPIFGTLADFELLIKEAQKRSINIMMDMIFNHCSTEHQWFKEVLKNNKEYLNRFFFVKNKKNDPPTNWQSKFGGSAWEYSEQLQAYYLHLFDKTQIDLNWEDELLKKDIYEIINYWLNKGVKGLRFDVINLIGKPKEFLNDQDGDGRKYYTDANNVHTYIQDMALNTYKKHRDVITVGELSSTAIEHTIKYTHPKSNTLDMAFTFHHLKIDYLNNDKWSLAQYKPSKLVSILKEWQTKIQDGNSWLALFLNNHDQPRALSRFGDTINYRYQSACCLAGITLLLRGTPFLYQGEEFGMENNNYNNIDELHDVESKNYYQILKAKGINKENILKILSARSRDNARSPMQWNDSNYAGFSEVQPWININKNYLKVNFKKDYLDRNSIFKSYQKLIALRKNNIIFSQGKIEFIDFHPDVLSFYREYEDKKALVLINLSKNIIILNTNLSSFAKNILFNNYDTFTNNLAPYQLVVCN